MSAVTEKESSEPSNEAPKPRAAIRGRAAALLANLDDSDSDSDGPVSAYSFKFKKTGGIYSSVLNETKKEFKDTQKKFAMADKNLLADKENKENEAKLKQQQQKTKKAVKSSKFSDDELDTSSENGEQNSDSDSVSSSTSNATDRKKKKIEREEAPSPPPPPMSINKQKRKSLNLVDKQLKELEKIRNQTAINMRNVETVDSFNSSINLVEQCNLEEELDTITVRVSTKGGIRRWELNKNQSFMKVFEELSKIEETGVENLLLMLDDLKISFNDTPSSLNLKIYSIIYCSKIATVIQERIKIIENDGEPEVPPNMLTLTLQSQEGRKSRVKFLISKNEKFENILKKFCEKRELKDFSSYIMEIDGEIVDLKSNPDEFGLDGEEIFDVKKSNKPTLEHVKQNEKNYEFDDDIIVV